MRTNRFAVTLDGVEAYIFPQEAQVFINVAQDLRAIIEMPALGEDPVRERLFPRAYLDPTEESAEIAWAAFAHPEMMESKVNTLVSLVDSLSRLEPAPLDRNAGEMQMVVLSPQETECWLKGLNDLRIALGTRLNIDEEQQEVDEDDPMYQLRGIYEWLTALQQDMLEQVYL